MDTRKTGSKAQEVGVSESVSVKASSVARRSTPTVSLAEFCSELSATNDKVELIGGFHFDQKRQGNLKNSRAAFQQAFADFCVKPI